MDDGVGDRMVISVIVSRKGKTIGFRFGLLGTDGGEELTAQIDVSGLKKIFPLEAFSRRDLCGKPGEMLRVGDQIGIFF